MILADLASERVRVLLSPARTVAEWHATLSAEIAAHLSPAHAAILARPSPSAAGTEWSTDAVRAVHYLELPMADREALRRAVTVILSDIRRLAEGGAAPAVMACWPALREIPDLGLLFAADGCPVLAGWACAPAAVEPRGLLEAMDDGRPWRGQPRTPWRVWGLAGGALATLALALGLFVTLLALPRAAPVACTVAPEELAALDTQAQGDARHNALLAELARLVDEQGRSRLQCPIPQAPALHATATPPALPLDQWQHHDLAMLKGCWSRSSSMMVENQLTHQLIPIASWRLCFDDKGAGTQTITRQDGNTCTGPLQATFDGDRMVTTAELCVGQGWTFVRSRQDCTRVGDEEAHCHGTDLEGRSANGGGSNSIFRR